MAHKHAAKPTGWERLLNKAGAERRVTKATALDAFALAMGPIPGIHVSHNDVGVVDSGDDAVDWILPYIGHLTRRQRTAVRAELIPRQWRGHRQARLAMAAAASLPGTQGLTENVALSRAADGYADEYGGLLKLHPSFKSFVYYGNFPERQSGPIAASYGLDAQGGKSGPPVTCLIALNPFNKFAISSVQETLAHEVFHCFQTQILGSWNKVSALKGSETWLVEGGAQWAGCEVQTGPVGEGWYGGGAQGYLTTPETELFSRTYDAIGFFDEVRLATRINPFTTMAAALTAGSNAGAYHKLLDGHDEQLLDDWAASFAQDPSRGPQWRPSGPCYNKSTPISPKPVKVSSTGTEEIRIGSHATTIKVLELAKGDYTLDIKVTSGRARLSASGINDVIAPDDVSPGGGDRYYSIGSGGTGLCNSTASRSAKKGLDESAIPVYLALTGEAGGGSATVSVLKCPTITNASFKVDNASFSAESGSKTTSWTAGLHWDVSWGPTSQPSSLPLKVGNYMYANAATMSGGGSYSATINSQPPITCGGALSLPEPGVPGDALIKVTGDTIKNKQRVWTLQLRATDYDSFFSGNDTCPAPPFGDTADSFGGHLWEANVQLPATDSTKEHTVTLNVASDPKHAPIETWTGKVTLTGTF